MVDAIIIYLLIGLGVVIERLPTALPVERRKGPLFPKFIKGVGWTIGVLSYFIFWPVGFALAIREWRRARASSI